MSEPPSPVDAHAFRWAHPDGPTVLATDEQDDHEIDPSRWARLAGSALVDEGVATGELSLHFVDRDAITDLNRRFMDETGPTDVLAFPLDADDPIAVGVPGSPAAVTGSDETTGPPVLLGDIVVCPAVAAENASTRDVALDDELALLVVHGVLHVLGHDHREPDETRVMRQHEASLLERHHGSAG